ncbi:hypothetical protein [Halobacillus halophilus]|uniref:hypothetical protein n=1 Tax=Halobacillus halophilus TaxID=1570 RepID=UPI001CD30FA8|nr:hypothetical protein [Halobacillus halophilus]MCA1010706.1 hypothetical protein [Halobacillus halophilus]
MEYPEEGRVTYVRVTKKLLNMIEDTNDAIFEMSHEFIMASLKKGNVKALKNTPNQPPISDATIQDVLEQTLFTKSSLADVFEDEDGHTYLDNPAMIYENFSVAYKIMEQSIFNMRQYIDQVDDLSEALDPEESLWVEGYLSMEAKNTINKLENVMKQIEQVNTVLEVQIYH